MDETVRKLEEIAGSVVKSDPRPEWLVRLMRSPENADRFKYVYNIWGGGPEHVDDNSLYYRFLYAVSKTFKPELSVEIGTLCGFSAAHIAAGNPAGKLLSVDIDPKAGKMASALCSEFGIGSVEFVTSDSCAFSSDPRMDRPIGLLFIDGEHTYTRATKELELYLPKMVPGGIVAIDDIDMPAEMKGVWNSIRFPKASIPGLHTIYKVGFGVVVVRP